MLPGCPPGLRQPAVPVAEQRPGDDREPEIEDREDKQLVPQDVTAVCLAMQSAGRDSDVEVHAVLGSGLQQVEDVQPDHPQRVGVPDFNVCPSPQAGPGALMTLEKLVEARCPAQRVHRRHRRLEDRAVVRGEDGRQFVDGD
jgi:hypothetical protein